MMPNTADPLAATSVNGALPLEPATGRGRRHGTSSSEPFDRWFRYPAGFASDYVSVLLRHLDLRPGSLVVDPFAGSAVTGTAARAADLSFFGVEAHPLITELGCLKLQYPPGDARELTQSASRLTDEASQRVAAAAPDLDSEAELVRRCFTGDTLARLGTLRDLIRSGVAAPWTDYLKWALLATLRDVASVRVGWPYQRPGTERRPIHGDVFGRFRQRAAWMAADLGHMTSIGPGSPYARIVHGDARDPRAWTAMAPAVAQGCVSSPPYLNNFDYADATRLELYFWGVVASWSQMCATVRSSMITATTQQSTVASAKTGSENLQRFHGTAATIAALADRLQAERTGRKRGKEYDRVLPAYFAAIGEVLANLAKILAPGAPTVWLIGDSAPYGVYVDTPALIAEIAGSLGFIVEKDVLLRRRGQRWSANSTRHSVNLSERLILLRRQ
jgi:hypothetical protein